MHTKWCQNKLLWYGRNGYLSLVHLMVSVGEAINFPVVGLFVNNKLASVCVETVLLVILLPS